MIGAFIAAEIAADLLVMYPREAWLWYLNLAIFGDFERARAISSPLHLLFGPSALGVATMMLLATLLVHRRGHRLGVALIANLCFIGTVALLMPRSADRALGALAALDGWTEPSPDRLVVLVMFASSLVACLASHLAFLQRVVGERWRGRTVAA